MEDAATILLPFLGLLAVVVLLRIGTKGRFEVKTPDIVLAAVPVGLWLLATGKLESLSVGDLTIKAFQKAAAAPAGQDARSVEPLAVQEISSFEKGAPSAIPDLISSHTEALVFRLGSRGYVGWAVQDYLDRLTAAPWLRWIVLEDPDGGFWGLADARELASLTRGGTLSADELAARLNAGEDDDRRWLATSLPGFVPADEALAAEASRQEALQRFESNDTEVLPALDADGRLRGLVRRDTLVTGLLADVTARLDGGR